MILPMVLEKRLREGVVRNHIKYSHYTVSTKILYRLRKGPRVKGGGGVWRASKRNRNSYLIAVGLGKNFLSIETVEKTTEEMIDKFDCIEFKLLCIKSHYKPSLNANKTRKASENIQLKYTND